MESIIRLIERGFAVFNINSDKEPCNGHDPSQKIVGWNSRTPESFRPLHNLNDDSWGLRLGMQSDLSRILSLDFDCCGDAVDGIRQGCPETLALLEDLRSRIGNDGQFTSSTEGNVNILVDISASPAICDLVNSLGKSRHTVHHLEFLVGGYQAIPPTRTKSKISGDLGPPRQHLLPGFDSFFNEILYDTDPLAVFIIHHLGAATNKRQREISEDDDEQPREMVPNLPAVVNIPVTVLNVAIDISEKPKYRDLLFGVIRGHTKLSWEEWVNVVSTMKTNHFDNDEILEFTGPFADEATQRHVDNYGKFQMGIGTIINIAKRRDLVRFLEWCLEWDHYVGLKGVSANILANEKLAAEAIGPLLMGNVVICGKNWYTYNETVSLWEKGDFPISYAVNQLNALADITYAKMEETPPTGDDGAKIKAKALKSFMDLKNRIPKSGYCAQIQTFMKPLLSVPSFETILDVNKYCVAFANGILDLRDISAGVRDIVKTDYLTKCLGFDWELPLDEDVETVMAELLKICNMDPSHLEYFLGALGYAMLGDASRLRQFYYILGVRASNGKTTIFEALEAIFLSSNAEAMYILKVQSSYFQAKSTTAHKTTANLEGMRICFAEEMPRTNLNTELLKQLADGNSITYDVMFGVAATIPITSKFFILSNHEWKAPDQCNGLERRIRVIELNSDFLDKTATFTQDDVAARKFVKDNNFAKRLTSKLRQAFLFVIFRAGETFYREGSQSLPPVPKEWADRGVELNSSNDQFPDWFHETFEFSATGMVSKRVFEPLFAKFLLDNKLPDNKFNPKLRSSKIVDADKLPPGIRVFYDSQTRDRITKGAWKGFKLRDDLLVDAPPMHSLPRTTFTGDGFLRNVVAGTTPSSSSSSCYAQNFNPPGDR